MRIARTLFAIGFALVPLAAPAAGAEVSAEVTAETPAPMPAELLDAYFGARPETRLHDPQGLLREDVRGEIEEFLDYHAEDSAVDFRVNVFAGDQQLPVELDPDALAWSWFAGEGPGFIVFYHAGKPERSSIHLSPTLAEGIPEAERYRILSQAMVAGQKESGVGEQLKAFCVQLAIRVYWMEQEAGLVEEAPIEAVLAEPEAGADAGAGEGESPLQAIVKRWTAPVAVVAGSLLLAGFGVAWTLARRRFRFPEIEVASRLGGAHGAGIGPVMHFGDTTQSPSRQRERKLDTLGGV